MSESTTVPRSDETAIGVGAILVLLGIVAYVITDFASVTALIPVFFGIPLVILGVLGRGGDFDQPVRYGIAILALITAAGSLQGIDDIIGLLQGGSLDGAVAPVSQAIMLVLGVVLLIVVGRELLGSEST